MGFTRYWKQPHGIDPDSWRAIVRDTETLLSSSPIPVLGAVGSADDDELE